MALVIKGLTANEGDAGDLGSIPGLRRSLGEGNDTPLQYPGLGNPWDRGTWWATVHGAAGANTTEPQHTAYQGRITT